ncbi:MAG: hypothetical protein HUK17_04270 [Bacteroidales bacterium]|nr:hypothetical protein [Bacteroidales bacterium]
MNIKETDYFAFIIEHLISYSSSNKVLWSDILTRYIFGEEVQVEDVENIQSFYPTLQSVVDEALRVDSELLISALVDYEWTITEGYQREDISCSITMKDGQLEVATKKGNQVEFEYITFPQNYYSKLRDLVTIDKIEECRCSY